MSLACKLMRRTSVLSVSRMLLGRKYCATGRSVEKTPSTKLLLSHYLFPRGVSYSSTRATARGPCWRCGQSKRKDEFFCQDCNALQRPENTYNFFHLFGLKESFNLNLTEISRKFRQLQALLHPDKFSNASDDEKEFSADLSSLINKAFRTLSDPLERGNYLLSLYGLSIEEENTSFNKAFLMEVMELNEELEAISTLDQLKTFNAKNKEMLSSIQEKVSESFSSKDVDSAKAALMEMKYFTTLESKIKEKMLLLEEI